MEANTAFTAINYRTVDSANGVTLRECGEGEAVFVFPGMEGSGESCLHLAEPVINQARLVGTSHRLMLVDYAREEHATLGDLIETINQLIQSETNDESCVFWAQSFGNLLATGVANLGKTNVRKFLFVSPFTKLPVLKTYLGSLGMHVTPTYVHRATIEPIGRYIFGPTGDQKHHPFFSALRRSTPAVVGRRTGWLRSRQFSAFYESISAPAKVWLGKRDRLVDLAEQRSFFTTLLQDKENYRLSMIEGSGHVVLPSPSVQRLRQDLLAWLVE